LWGIEDKKNGDFRLAWREKNKLATRAKPSGGKACGDLCRGQFAGFEELMSGCFLCPKGGGGAQKIRRELDKKKSSTCAQPNASKEKKYFWGGLRF
jgi:hypothetical protein